MSNFSPMSDFHVLRSKYCPQLPALLRLPELNIKTHPVSVVESIRKLFPSLCDGEVKAVTFEPVEVNEQAIRSPLRIGCVLSGGQAAGGHNVIVGLYEQIKRRHPNSQLFGFLKGPIGIYSGKYMELKDEIINYFKNRGKKENGVRLYKIIGGFDMIQSGRHKIETEEQFQKSLQHCQSLKLDGLVVIGGDDSNTNACLLAEYFKKNGCSTAVVGCPKTIDGDLKNEFVEVSFGFDTACKTYSELIGNIMLDTVSSKKYYHFIRLMGRSASHITLECALLTKPNWVYIGEEVQAKQMTLNQIVHQLCDLICERLKRGKNYGVVLVPEGLIEFICEVNILISEINVILGKKLENPGQYEIDVLFHKVKEMLTQECAQLLEFLPKEIRDQLLLDRDPHGNVQVAKIETEKLLVSMVQIELEKRKQQGTYTGKFTAITHYYGYEGRCAFPTNFDSDYCYGLGVNAALLIEAKQTGMMSCIRQLHKEPVDWQASGYPLVTMMDVEIRKGKPVPVIKKALTDLDGDLFKIYQSFRDKWAINDAYHPPGPIQFNFKVLNPFLVKTPTLEQLDEVEEKLVDYTQGQPYDIVQRTNLSLLGYARATNKIQLPLHLNAKLEVHSISTNYSHETNKALLTHFPELYAVSHNAFELRTSRHHTDVKPIKFAVSFNGRQSPGANSIIFGLLEYAKQTNSQLFGFINGTQGLFQQQAIQLNYENCQFYLNQGGFHLLGRSADKMRTPSELESIKKTCLNMDLDGLIIVGASHSLTDSIIVANYLLKENCKTRVITIPCTVDNNIGHPMLEGIVGFDSASKTYSQLIGNIMIDAASAVKYWYFIRLMGRDPSHLVLESALQTKPNVVLISEAIAQRGQTLADVVNEITEIIVLRANKGKEFGTVLVPEGLLSHIGQFKQLISELNKYYSQLPKDPEQQKKDANQLLTDENYAKKVLSPWSAALFLDMPDFTQKQLVLEREVHGGVQLTQIETEKLLAHLVTKELKKRKEKKDFKGSFSPICHFFGYQGRCAFPSLFDSQLGQTYGFLAGLFVAKGLTGFCVTARGVTGTSDKWHFAGIPLLGMCTLKSSSSYGENEPVIGSYEVDLKKRPYQRLAEQLREWHLNDYYENPGPIQFYGEQAGTINMTLQLSYQNCIDKIENILEATAVLNNMIRLMPKGYETREELLNVVQGQLHSLMEVVKVIQGQ